MSGVCLFISGQNSSLLSKIAKELEGQLLERDIAVEFIDIDKEEILLDLTKEKKLEIVIHFCKLFVRNNISLILKSDDIKIKDIIDIKKKILITDRRDIPYAEVLVSSDIKDSVINIIKTLEHLNFIKRLEGSSYSNEEDIKVQERLRGLGYIE
ncbi:MAG: hypothetical protein AB1765_00675 [Candidatus Hydrogenedentota bacterium]